MKQEEMGRDIAGRRCKYQKERNKEAKYVVTKAKEEAF